MTVLEIIQKVQQELRLPQASSLSQPHAKILLNFINKAQRNLMTEDTVWDELKVYGSFDTTADNPYYRIEITTPDAEVDIIRTLYIEGYADLEKKSDEDFRALKLTYGNSGQPLYYRIFARDTGTITVELLPTPDAIYTINAELLQKPPRLTAEGEIPLLDADTIIESVLFMAQNNQGDDYSLSLASFQSKVSQTSTSQGDSNWGDIEI